MKLLAISIVSTVAVIGVACGQGSPPEDDGSWVGTITTEGTVTTVVNESGSVWGGPARLIEEASIGVDVGAAEYMFGDVSGIAASDEYIYVGDGSIPVVRAYDYAGRTSRTRPASV